jgi:hypothetical protein
MGTPNSSELWIRWMAFRLSLHDAEGARALVNRALQR